jgi:nitrate reductase gamma subunit
MTAVLIHVLTYTAVAVFVGAVAWRFVKIQTMPLHLRWELYPVAHEAGDKAKYGGSRLEELNHWNRPVEKSLLNELRYMIPEMTLLVALFEHNRKLWWRSFPFHFGLYLLAGLIGLLFAGSILENIFHVYVGPEVARMSIIGTPLFYLTKLTALLGLSLATVGAAGLLHRRLFDEDLKDFTSFGHIFNLLAFLVVFAVAWLTFVIADNDFAATRSFIWSLLTFQLSAPLAGANALHRSLLGIEIVLATLLIAYIPLTHMSHFFIKWFTYHQVRWDDEANEVGSAMEKKIMEQVQYPVTWSAKHLNADGKKNWVDIATEDMPR